MHAGAVGDEARGIGDRRHLHHGLRAVDELDQHAHVHVAALRFLRIVIRHGIDIERIVLALAGGDDGMAHGRDEFDELHARRWFVARAQRVGDAEPVGLALEIGADGDVGLDIHHHQMLAMFHGAQPDLGAHGGNAGGIDDDVDQAGVDEEIDVIGDRDLALLHRGIELIGRPGLTPVALGPVGDIDRLARRRQPQFGNGADLDSRHVGDAGDDVGSHLARADEADSNGPPAVGACQKIAGQSGGCNIDRHGHLSLIGVVVRFRRRLWPSRHRVRRGASFRHASVGSRPPCGRHSSPGPRPRCRPFRSPLAR